MADVVIHGITVHFPQEASADVIENLRRTLLLVPRRHLPVISQIVIFPAPADGYAGGGSGLGYPRLSELCFDRRRRPRNRPYNLTLLHEVGHIVDHHYHCLETMQRDAPDDYAALRSHIHIAASRRTHGPGELYADAYQKMVTGNAPPVVRDALLRSTAFLGGVY